MIICDKCRRDGLIQVYAFGEPGQSYSETLHLELCNDCRDKLLKLIHEFLESEEPPRS